jgi:TPR repeat protein
MKRAGDQGLPLAQHNFGVYLEGGRGVAKDLALAAHYYKLAMDKGFGDAKGAYERVRSSE